MLISLESIVESAKLSITDRSPKWNIAEQTLPAYLTPSRPTTYTLELIAACNHKCIGCGNVFSRQMEYMPASTWIQLLDGLRQDIVSLRITGGECTLHPGFAEIIQAVDQLAVPYVVFTNGRWRNPSQIIDLFAGCNHLDGLLISLHGHTPESYSAFVVTDSFNVITNNIQRAAQAGIRVGTNTILFKSNINHIREVSQLSFSLGTQSAAFSRYYGNPLPELELQDYELENAMAHIAQLRKEEPRVVFNNCVPMCFTDIDIPTKGCTSGFTHCTIDPLGNARPCTHSPYMLGNLFEQEIAEIWDSEPLWEWRNLIPQACTGCGAFNQCRGGCRATAVHQGLTQDPLIRSPLQHETPAVQIVKLYRNARLITNYTMQEEYFGYYLINRNRHMPVSKKALPILLLMEERATLAAIEARLGPVAVDFVGTLLLNGLVEMETT